MIETRSDEQKYAFLRTEESREKNRYGDNIELAEEGNALREVSLNINGDTGISENPDRYKQHGFYLNADNCIGCHACEAACSEKNDNPAHISFRSVGYVEGGTYPDYQRLNISMACNHCDDPVCLKGCPTRAYTKFAEYGAVLQDPDICFGCGYCTWVCPYNAPQLDPVKGEVSKCNMCVDRLEVGLKPSCVSACLGNALDFGVIENVPENREQAQAEIPGFPTTDITHPNIRFQQTRQNKREMTRTDSMPLKYHKDEEVGKYKPVVDEKHGVKKQWNWKALLMTHESSHVIFTLSTQAILGAFLIIVLGSFTGVEAIVAIQSSAAYLPLLVLMNVLLMFGFYKLNMHLGKPHRFYRGFYNLRHSPVSREIAGVSLFFASLLGFSILSFFEVPVLSGLFAIMGVISGPVGLFYMYKLYRIKARPFWDHWQTASSFVGTCLSLGSLTIVFVALIADALNTTQYISLVVLLLLGLLLEAIGHVAHAADLKNSEGEGSASWYLQTTRFAWPYIISNVLLGSSIIVSCLLLDSPSSTLGWLILGLSLLSTAVIRRSLFFALVIPTTMPGAFFWKNKAFEEHAKETGLANMPQVGVRYEEHRTFKVGELIDTIKTTTAKEAIDQLKEIFYWKKVK
ncbi:DmsC/YnfH family molybdoenzyme membrane anchor subunit [Cycloclasticus sp.]|uniref:DmsC/YnfH family molybdoenzyme membrane anchor subunit n=1 Tax=Cycloclasticus sp. TaxID=2024830 RepID=UPI000C10CC4B|nr:DmsC/YnfH family molybdoenzyme membrane anchor subunit [Cycloclasticus sp.]PHR52080.1 MAG: aspartate carbamoyltransferase [Cycloclasticus sp.]